MADFGPLPNMKSVSRLSLCRAEDLRWLSFSLAMSKVSFAASFLRWIRIALAADRVDRKEVFDDLRRNTREALIERDGLRALRSSGKSSLSTALCIFHAVIGILELVMCDATTDQICREVCRC